MDPQTGKIDKIYTVFYDNFCRTHSKYALQDNREVLQVIIISSKAWHVDVLKIRFFYVHLSFSIPKGEKPSIKINF